MRLFNTALAAALLVAGTTPSFAEYPDHAIQIVVPYTPGGTVDLLARAWPQAYRRLGAASHNPEPTWCRWQRWR